MQWKGELEGTNYMHHNLKITLQSFKNIVSENRLN